MSNEIFPLIYRGVALSQARGWFVLAINYYKSLFGTQQCKLGGLYRGVSSRTSEVASCIEGLGPKLYLIILIIQHLFMN